MTQLSKRDAVANRRFIALVRAELDAIGHADIPVSRQWVDEDTPGYEFLLNVPLGAELVVPLEPLSDFMNADSDEAIKSHVGYFVKALVNLRLAEKELEKYVGDVRRAAVKEIAAARAEGLDLLLVGVGFKPTCADHLSGSSWKDAALYLLAEITIRNTSFYLRPETTEIWVEEPGDVVREMVDLRNEQRERQKRLAELEARSADLEVDQITLDLLAAHKLDVGEVLRDVWKRQCVSLKVEHLGRETYLSLVSGHGKVTASIVLEDAIWNGEHLCLLGDEDLKDHKVLIGKSLGALVRHPVFGSRPIVDIIRRHIDYIVFDLSDKILFDAEAGQIRREARLAA